MFHAKVPNATLIPEPVHYESSFNNVKQQETDFGEDTRFLSSSGFNEAVIEQFNVAYTLLLHCQSCVETYVKHIESQGDGVTLLQIEYDQFGGLVRYVSTVFGECATVLTTTSQLLTRPEKYIGHLLPSIEVVQLLTAVMTTSLTSLKMQIDRSAQLLLSRTV